MTGTGIIHGNNRYDRIRWRNSEENNKFFPTTQLKNL